MVLLIVNISFHFQALKLLGGKRHITFGTESHSVLGVQYRSLKLNKEINMEGDRIFYKYGICWN